MQRYPYLGFGLGLRPDHYQDVLDSTPTVDWFELLSENYMVPGGKPLYFLDRITERYPVVMHGVSLSIGSVDPLDSAYLDALKSLADRTRPHWVSDHLCWTGVDGLNVHDLLPLPYTEEALAHVAARVRKTQEHLERPFLLENVSTYLTYEHSAMTEWDFLRGVAEEADCGILLDINNIYVSSFNHGFDPADYLAGIPAERVAQFHLAGHTNRGDCIIDTHDHPIVDPVWRLYEDAMRQFGPVSTMIERDADIPPLDDLLEELAEARRLARGILPMEPSREAAG